MFTVTQEFEHFFQIPGNEALGCMCIMLANGYINVLGSDVGVLNTRIVTSTVAVTSVHYLC